MSNRKAAQLLADRIKQARQDMGWSQKDLGQALQLSDKAVSSYEVGRAEPTISTLKDLSRVTMKPLGYFLDEADPADLELQSKLQKIESELLAVKKLLQQQADQKNSR